MAVEHIIQDAGSPGIEEFAREIGADFYRDGALVFASSMARGERREASAGEEESRDESRVAEASTPLGLDPRPPTLVPRPYRIAVYCERDAGMYDAINRGLRRATGDICAWINCDEQYLSGSLEQIGDYFSHHADAEMVVGDTILLNSLIEPRSFRLGVPPIRDYIQIFNLNLHSSSLFFRRKLLDRGIWLGDRFRSIGDSEWIAKLMDSGVRIHPIHRDISTFVLGEDNLSQNELSSAEKNEWRKERIISFSGRVLLRFRHLVRRLAAGAYLPRRRVIAVFTPSDPANRKTFRARWLDFRFRV